MGGPPSFKLPAGDAIGEGTPDVCGDRSCIACICPQFCQSDGLGSDCSHPRIGLMTNPPGLLCLLCLRQHCILRSHSLRHHPHYAEGVRSMQACKAGGLAELTGVPLSDVKLSLLLNLERQSSFFGAWKAEGAGGGDRPGVGRRSPWAAAFRSGVPAAASSFDCTTTCIACARQLSLKLILAAQPS